MIVLKRAIGTYMSARCQVSSQHKLPGREELYDSVTLGLFFSREDIGATIDEMIKEGTLIEYGPYLSDHVIDVL